MYDKYTIAALINWEYIDEEALKCYRAHQINSSEYAWYRKGREAVHKMLTCGDPEMTEAEILTAETLVSTILSDQYLETTSTKSKHN